MSANSQNAKVMGLLHRYAERMGVPSEQLYATLLKVIFKRSEAVREEELLAFLLVCEKYGLDPFLKEIYPTLTQKQGLLHLKIFFLWEIIFIYSCSLSNYP